MNTNQRDHPPQLGRDPHRLLSSVPYSLHPNSVSMDLGDGLFDSHTPSPGPYYQQRSTPQLYPSPPPFHNSQQQPHPSQPLVSYHGPLSEASSYPSRASSHPHDFAIAPPAHQHRQSESTDHHPSDPQSYNSRLPHAHTEYGVSQFTGLVGGANGWNEGAPRQLSGSASSSGTTTSSTSYSTSTRAKKATSTRTRTAKSCAPCRRRKVRCATLRPVPHKADRFPRSCDRVSPCSQCTERTESHLCVWDESVLPRKLDDVALTACADLKRSAFVFRSVRGRHAGSQSTGQYQVSCYPGPILTLCIPD